MCQPYTGIVVRVFFASCLFAFFISAQQPPPAKKTPPPVKQEEEPPEEDESITPKEYTLNPLEAARNITAGNYYFKKHNYRAASRRYLEATKWDPTSVEAFLKLGETYEKLKDRDGIRDAYEKYLALAPDAKNAPEIRKKLEKVPQKK
jgi:tetratricopeptide (TPR) repeat protein